MTGRRTGWMVLAGVALRRDRLLVTAWAAGLTVLVYASASATPALYATAGERVAAARALNASPATVALYGPIVDERSLGELAMTKLTVLYAVFVAALVVVLVRRHTRSDEEAGRTELVCGAGAGRDAPLGAALVLTVLVSSGIGILAAGADAAAGLPVAGSVAFGAAWVGTGLVAGALTAVCCQLSASTRTCGGAAAASLVGLYLLRAFADVEAPWAGWLSVFGWGTRLHAWGGTRWWVLGLYLATAAALAGCAHALRARRDLAAGLLHARPGRSHGTRRLASCWALAWRLNRGTAAWWTVAVAAFGVVVGFMVPGVSDLLDTAGGRRLLDQLGGRGALDDALLAAVFSVSSIVVTGFGVGLVARADSDEQAGRSAAVVAAAGRRSGLVVAAAVQACVGTGWLLAVLGLATSVGSGQGLADAVGSALARAPAGCVVVGVTAAAYAVRAGWSLLGWVVLASCVALDSFGALLDLPGWLTALSPYAHASAMPAEPFAVAPFASLAVAAAVLAAVALAVHGRRDVG